MDTHETVTEWSDIEFGKAFGFAPGDQIWRRYNREVWPQYRSRRSSSLSGYPTCRLEECRSLSFGCIVYSLLSG